MPRAGICKQGCGLPVQWVRDGRRWLCRNADGSDHWDLCSQTRTQRAIAEGTPFTEKNASGIVHQDRKLYMARTAPAKRKPLPSCAGCVPPWELCPTGCAIEFKGGN